MTNIIVIIETIEDVNVKIFTTVFKRNFCKVMMHVVYAFLARELSHACCIQNP